MNVACNSLVARNPLARRVWQAKRFEPSHIPGLGLDLDASYGVLNSIGPNVPATNGQSVRRWLDKSGNGRHYDQSTVTNQPTFNNAGDFAVLVGDGVDDLLLQTTGLDMISGAPGLTCFFVCASAFAAPTTNQNIFYLETNADAAWHLLRQLSDGRYFFGGRRVFTASAQTASGSSGSTAFRLVGTRVSFSTAHASMTVNGAQVAQISPFQTPGNAQIAVSDSITIFGRDNSVALPFSGKIARVLVWPRALTASELLRVHRYLSATYGIALA